MPWVRVCVCVYTAREDTECEHVLEGHVGATVAVFLWFILSEVSECVLLPCLPVCIKPLFAKPKNILRGRQNWWAIRKDVFPSVSSPVWQEVLWFLLLIRCVNCGADVVLWTLYYVDWTICVHICGLVCVSNLLLLMLQSASYTAFPPPDDPPFDSQITNIISFENLSEFWLNT